MVRFFMLIIKKFDTSKFSIVALESFKEIASDKDYSNVLSTIFVKYGIIWELMSRFIKLIAMNFLSEVVFKKILIESILVR